MQTQSKPADRTASIRTTEVRTLSDRQAMARLERMFAARKAGDVARANRFATVPESLRSDTRSNDVEWREQAMEKRIRTLPLPLPPGEDGSAPLVSTHVQTLILILVAISIAAVIAARFGGVL